MNKEFILYEQALELKELGFDEECMFNHKSTLLQVELPAPLYSQAFRWFREKYGLYNTVLPKQKDLGVFYGGGIHNINGQVNISYGTQYQTYEEAELACLNRLIAIAKRMELAKVAAKEVSEMKPIEDVAKDTANWIDKMVLDQMIEIAKTK